MTADASNGTSETKPTKPRRMSKRTTVIVSTVASVLVLAAVIFGVSALSSPSSDSDSIAVRTPAEQSADLFDNAIVKLESGEETEAVSLLRQALSLDPDNEAAQTELNRIIKDRADSSNSSGDNGGDSNSGDSNNGDSTSNDDAFDVEIADLSTLLPAMIDGYELGMVVSEGTDAQVPADPVQSGPSTVIRRALFSVHNRGTDADANSFVDSVTKSAFPDNAAEVTVNGVTAYFGTDGTRFATVAYTRGRYVFEVIITAEDGAPGSLVDLAVDAASAFPTSP